jgi:cytochrome c553
MIQTGTIIQIGEVMLIPRQELEQLLEQQAHRAFHRYATEQQALMAKEQTATQPDEQELDTEEVARFLRCHVKTVLKYSSSEHPDPLPCRKGRPNKYLLSQVMAWRERQKPSLRHHSRYRITR